jgi:nitrile hydratase subunit beta
MGRIHDIGGMRGFGAVDPDDDEHLAFHEGWEARIFGVVRALRQNRVCTPDEWRHAVERLPPATYLSTSYYERWVLAAERIAVEKGVLQAGQVDALLEAGRPSEADD